MKINEQIKEKIVLALDVDDIEEAKAIITELKDYVGTFKIGLQLYTANSCEIFRFMKEQNIKFFFDVKLSDIPNTVKKATENIVKNGATFFNVHTLGGSDMMKAAADAAHNTAEKLGLQKPMVLGVTLLTSIDEAILNNELRIPHKTNDYVVMLALNAQKSGLDGVVASVWETKMIKQACGKNFKVLCPGIRPSWSVTNDQKRLATPKAAIKEGADYLVIGRAVTSAENRVEAILRIYDEIEDAILTQNESFSTSKAKLLLENGMIFEGESVGANKTVMGMLTFNNSTVGYQEILTDPAYADEIVVLTYPEIGNYGINKDDSESGKIHLKGLIVKNICANESHYKSVYNVSDYLKQNNIIAVSNIDTRLLTQIIRDNGSMKCLLTTGEITKEMKEKLKEYTPNPDVISEVSTYKAERHIGSGVRLALVDLGTTKSVVNALKSLNCDITIFPANVDAEEILNGGFEAVIISNGPGIPENALKTIETVKTLFGKIRIYGISLGLGVIALALGLKMKKMKTGHCGSNYPIINKENDKVAIVSQNHSYVLDETSLTSDVIVTYENLNDGTIEGFKSQKYSVEAVQFYPETIISKNETNKTFPKWISEIEENLASI